MSCHRCDSRNILACGICAGESKLSVQSQHCDDLNEGLIIKYFFYFVFLFLRCGEFESMALDVSPSLTSHNVLVYHSGLDMEGPLALRWPEPLRAKVAGKKPPKNKHFRLDQPDASYPNPNPFACCFFGRRWTFSVEIDNNRATITSNRWAAAAEAETKQWLSMGTTKVCHYHRHKSIAPM
jgi:hypothetical protein